MLVSLVIILALLSDAVLGEPKRWHPLVGFGRLANWVEHKVNLPQYAPTPLARYLGLTAWFLVVVPIVAVITYLEKINAVYFNDAEVSSVVISVIVVTIAIGAKSLTEHAKAVEVALVKRDLTLARKRIAMMVSRDTTESDEKAITKATVESVLENGSDAIFAALFWFAVLGAPGVVLYRLSNTLDAMWGYHTDRYHYFGWAAARIDDVLNWLPARLTAISYSLAGSTRTALRCWSTQAKNWNGINPGVVMASGAGALKIKLGGVASYHGVLVPRPELGDGNEAEVKDISRATRLVRHSIFIWVIAIVIIDFVMKSDLI
jgi:adenosylcobinamide-phosphate synthase